jgi:hypothetical protein
MEMTPPTLKLDFSWANDGMNVFVPAANLDRGRTFYDDDGFTNDLAASVVALRKGDQLGLHFQDRMITERGGLRRSDEISALARLEKLLIQKRGHEFRLRVGVGVLLTGPLGGDVLQDRFHRLIRWGRTLNGELKGQLQNQYEGEVEWAPRLELGLAHGWQVSKRFHLSAGAQLAYSPGVGASATELSVGIERTRRVAGGQLKLSAKLPLRYVRSEEERLSFRGGYPRGKFFLQPLSGIAYQRRTMGFAFDLSLNVEGTGAHQGILSFSYYLGNSIR